MLPSACVGDEGVIGFDSGFTSFKLFTSLTSACACGDGEVKGSDPAGVLVVVGTAGTVPPEVLVVVDPAGAVSTEGVLVAVDPAGAVSTEGELFAVEAEGLELEEESPG